jgi:hypothetical protein
VTAGVRRSYRASALALFVGLGAPLAASSCQALAGIEERELGPCGEYCDVVMRNCVGDFAAYETREKCLGTCLLFEPGDPIEPQGTNTVECRLREARRAETAISEELPAFCRGAGPEGIGCAPSTCEAYCSLVERACGMQCNSHATCVDKCRALRDEGSFNAFEDYEGDTIQCRLVHISNATLDAALHCDHAKLVTPSVCVDGPEEHEEGEEESRPSEPRCEDYCRVIGVACTGEFSEYASDEECLATCATLEPGSFEDTASDTIGCRLYHAYNALCVPDPHCSHAGPSGGGKCVDAE